MPLSIFQIPVTYTITGTRLIPAASPEEAFDLAERDMQVGDHEAIRNSNLLWDEGAKVTDVTDKVEFGLATNYEGNPADVGFEPEELETEAEADARLAYEAKLDHDASTYGSDGR